MTPTYLEAIPLNYRKYGDTGPDLIVLHGLFGSGKNWRSFARSIVNDFQIWMPDARNHGESPHAETMSYKEMAEDVVCFLDNNGLERIMLLGHSMGGKTAMQVALRFPERVSCLIVVDIAPVQYEHFQKNIKLIRAMQELGLPKIMTRAEVEIKLADKIDEKHILSFLMTNLICKGGTISVANRFRANSFRFTGTVKLFKSGKYFFRTNSFPWWCKFRLYQD